MSELDSIPVAYCNICDEDVPVMLMEVPLSILDNNSNPLTNGDMISVIFCPVCESLLNTEHEVKLSYYSRAQLGKVTNWEANNEIK